MGSRNKGGFVPKLVWRIRLVAEFGAGETMDAVVTRLERNGQADMAYLGRRLAEARQLVAAIQTEIVTGQVTVAGEHRCMCMTCEGEPATKGHDTASFGALSGDVPIRVRRQLTCPCQGRAKQ